MFFYCLNIKPNRVNMEIAASIRGASKEYKADQTAIIFLQPTTFDFMKKELTLIIVPSGSGKTTQGSYIIHRQFAVK
jgi:ABC-type multidrug transport system ATPase subunit